MSRIETVNPAQATGKAKELLDGVKSKLGMTPNLMRVMANIFTNYFNHVAETEIDFPRAEAIDDAATRGQTPIGVSTP